MTATVETLCIKVKFQIADFLLKMFGISTVPTNIFPVCWSSQKECDHLLTLINKETGLVIGDVTNLPMFYCNTCGMRKQD